MPIVPVNARMLEQAEAGLRSLNSKAWLGELAQRVSAGGMKLTADCFRTSTDPYGKPWAPLKRERPRDKRARLRAERRQQRTGLTPKRTRRGAKVLIDTGRMRASAGASAMGATAKVTIPTWYAQFHQEGTVNHPFRRFKTKRLTKESMAREGTERMPQRMMLPSEERGLPPAWQSMLKRESQLFIAHKFGFQWLS